MDTTRLRRAYADLLEAAQAPQFNPPPGGEWDVEHLLAHLVSVDASITAVALAVVGGARPAYDNRVSLDRWNLDRIVSASGGAGGLRDQVREHGEVLCGVADHLHEDDLAVMVPTLILSNDQVMLDQPVPLGALIGGLAEVHLPGHAKQLGALHADAGITGL